MRDISQPERAIQKDVVSTSDGLTKFGVRFPSIEEKKHGFCRAVQHSSGFTQQVQRSQAAWTVRLGKILCAIVETLRCIDLTLERDDSVELVLTQLPLPFLMIAIGAFGLQCGRVPARASDIMFMLTG